MKIIIFDGTFKTTTFIYRLVKGVSRRNKVYIIGFNESNPNKIKNVEYLGLGPNNSNFMFIWRSIQIREYNPFLILDLLYSLLKKKKKDVVVQNIQIIINKIKPDIIHFQWASVLFYLNDLQLPENTKVIFSQRGFHINVKPVIDKEFKEKLTSAFKKVNGFHSVSNAIQNESNKLVEKGNSINRVIYSGLNFSDLPIKKSNKFNDKIQILSVGRSHWIKDYKTAIIAMSILKKQNVSFTYSIIGANPTEELLFIIDDLNLSDEIKFIPQIPNKLVYSKMLTSDMLILSSLEEGIANVCIEAMFCKLPVISTDCGGMNELIDDNRTGFLVPINSPYALYEKIIQLIGLDELEVENLTNKARKHVEQNHNIDKMISEMETFYKDVYEKS